MTTRSLEEISAEILSIKKDSVFLRYIVNRLRSKGYRGWHASQHNRYTREDVDAIIKGIYKVAAMDNFAIPPGDYPADYQLSAEFSKFKAALNAIKKEMERCTIDSLKKNFFPDLERMRFLVREKVKSHITGRRMFRGKLTPDALKFITAKTVAEKFKRYTDGVDNLFGQEASELAEIIYFSDYRGTYINIYEFMFILSDFNEGLDKISLLDSYRNLGRHEQEKAINLIKDYADPNRYKGKKRTDKRDFGNWKNQAQQILMLLNDTLYFSVSEKRDYFRLNYGKGGLFEEQRIRNPIPKRRYFEFHKVGKKDDFELHHIVPLSSARNRVEASMIDNHLNLIYIHKNKHRAIHRAIKNYGDAHVVTLTINSEKAIFSDFENKENIETKNSEDALYSKDENKIKKVEKYNKELLQSIFDFDES